MKKLFSTPKRAVISTLCIVAVVLIAAAGAVLLGNGLISKAEAKAVALADAGLDEADASALRARLEFDDGRFLYEVDFYNDGAEYEYQIQARDGDIISRDIDGGFVARNVSGESNAQQESVSAASGPAVQQGPVSAASETAAQADTSVQAETASQTESVGQTETVSDVPETAADAGRTASAQGVSLEEAKAAALADAGLTAADVTFKKEKTDYDNGVQVYDIEFYTADTEYDYEIGVSDGTVKEKSVEAFRAQTGTAANGNAAGTNGTVGKAGAGSANGTGGEIGLDRAKEIALAHAQLGADDVRFVKTELDYDDGRMEYEIEFYYGRIEYSYTVDAVTGDILEYDVDRD